MSHANLLLAEDDCDDVFMLRRAFKSAGLPCVLHFVEDGGEAIRWLVGQGIFADRNQFPVPDLIITDLKMPAVDGLDLLKWIRSQPAYATHPVILLSSSDEPSDIAKARSLGVTAYICKDQNFKTLIQYLQRHMPPCSGSNSKASASGTA